MKSHHFVQRVWSVHAQPEDWFCLSTKSGDRWRDHYFQWPVSRSELRTFMLEHERDNVYFCPTPLSGRRRKKSNVRGSAMLWADLDEARPDDCNPRPSIAWESSPNRYSALWLLDDVYEPQVVESHNKSLTYANGADKGGWDLTQVLRVPGTRNWKYEDGPLARTMWFTDSVCDLADVPDYVELDPGETLQRLHRRIPSRTYRALTAKRATMGKRSDMIWRLQNELVEAGLSDDEVLVLIKASVWNKFKGRRDEDAQLSRELGKIRDVSDRPSIAGARVNGYASLVRLADVEPERVSWLWHPYIPRGKLTLLEGDPGLGKSWLTLNLATAISTKSRLPGQRRVRSGSVLLFSAEDGLADTIRPRLDSMGANVRRVFAWNDACTFDDDGVEEISEQIESVKPSLVIVDPLVAYMGGGVDLHRANETREVMERMGRLAEKHRCAIVAVRHLTKGGRDRSIYRGLGSIDMMAAARSALLVGRSPDDSDSRIVCQIKNNLAPTGVSLEYRLGGRKQFEWIGTSEYTAEDLNKMKDAPTGSGRLRAVQFLADALSNGPVKMTTLRRDAEAMGIDRKDLRIAFRELNVKRDGSSASL